MADKREHPRAPIELRVDYRRLNSFFADYTRNISKGGTFIRSQKVLPLGTRFVFRISLPGRPSSFELSGEVVHSQAVGEQAGMGIHFVWTDEEERGQFEQLVEQLMVESLGPQVTEGLLRPKG